MGVSPDPRDQGRTDPPEGTIPVDGPVTIAEKGPPDHRPGAGGQS